MREISIWIVAGWAKSVTVGILNRKGEEVPRVVRSLDELGAVCDETSLFQLVSLEDFKVIALEPDFDMIKQYGTGIANPFYGKYLVQFYKHHSLLS